VGGENEIQRSTQDITERKWEVWPRRNGGWGKGFACSNKEGRKNERGGVEKGGEGLSKEFYERAKEASQKNFRIRRKTLRGSEMKRKRKNVKGTEKRGEDYSKGRGKSW